MDESDPKWIEDNMNDNIQDTGEFEGEVFMSTDGKNTVHVKATTREGRKSALIWADAVYKRLLHTYGTKQKLNTETYDKKIEGETENLGNCVKCGASNKRSMKGNIYCGAKCFLNK